MIEKLIRKQKLDLKEFRPFPSINKRKAWESLPEDYAVSLREAGESYINYTPAIITAKDWLAYTETGNRSDFEEKYFARRRALSGLVLAECCEDKGRFLGDIINLIFTICEESAWQLSAHNVYIRGTPVLPLPDVTRPVLDLFACETGALLSTTLYLLGDRISIISPRVISELKSRIVQPYLNDWFWWMGGRGEVTNNWTVWCTQNILTTMFFLDLGGATYERVLIKAGESVDYFLKDYGDDGCCDEGAGYYRHAGLCLFGSLNIIDLVTGGAIKSVWKNKKIRNIAHYILDVHVEDKYYINFADCSPIPGRSGAREFLFGKKCADSDLCQFAAIEWRKGREELKDEDKTRPENANLFYRAEEAFAAKEIGDYPIEEKELHRNIFYPSAGLFIARDSIYCLGVKAGDNDDSHNHNDTGSVIVYKNGLPFLIDVGVESYTKKTFSKDRYDIWTMQSSWHNLPDFDGIMQQNGAEFRATQVQHGFSEAEDWIDMELANAWSKEAGIESYKRRVVLKKNGKIYLTDKCKGSFKEGVLNLITCEEPVVEGRVIIVGNLGTVTIAGGGKISVETVAIKDARLINAWPSTIYRTRVMFKKELSLIID